MTVGLGPEPRPLALAIKRSLPVAATTRGRPSAVLPMTVGLGPEPRPLALAIKRSLPVAATTVGYHWVGTKPTAWRGWPELSLLRSKTAMESEMALAENRVFSSGESARYSGSLPPYCCWGSLVER